MKATLGSKVFQSTSSEEDVVSCELVPPDLRCKCFNPRPPKRTLCLNPVLYAVPTRLVSIHVLRRGRCVLDRYKRIDYNGAFQSTSSEEDVVSGYAWVYDTHKCVFQSTSSEEDVVSLQF